LRRALIFTKKSCMYDPIDDGKAEILRIETRAELDAILSEDVYQPFGGATYEVHEFKAAMVADNIKDYQG